MAYTKIVNFATKDATNDVIKGTEFDAEFNAIQVASTASEYTANKDATGGYAGLTLFKINFKNVANTFTSFFTNTNTASRTYTFQDRDGTIADTQFTVAKTSATGSAMLPSRTTTERNVDTPGLGYIGYNSTLGGFEGYGAGGWGSIGGAGATGGGVGNLQDLVFLENDTLVTNDYILGQGAQKTGATFTNGSANIGFTGHGFVAEQLVMFSTTGTLPTNFTAWVGYYVIATGLTADVFQVSLTNGGTAISAGSARGRRLHRCGW